jgi:hypothetical protein
MIPNFFEKLGPPHDLRFEKGKMVYLWKNVRYEAVDVCDNSKILVEGDVELTVTDSTIMGPGESPEAAITITPAEPT